jgi:outer membrane protein OmpA-like peptidoglycan-associated protein
MSRSLLVAAGVSILALTACVNPDSDINRTQAGAVTGAMVGGFLGARSGGQPNLGRALVGAGIGAAAGGLLGARLDAQAQDLRRSLGGDVDVRNTGQEIVLTLPQDILFASDSASLRPDLQRDLRSIAANLINYPDSSIQIVGHTDNTGSLSHNQQLSERRAQAVAAVLRDAGVPAHRIVTTGAGPAQPIATNSTAAGRAQNRRVEIIIRPTS